MPNETWSPNYAAHVVGTYSQRAIDRFTGDPEPQHINITCGKCGETYYRLCDSGRARHWIATFAIQHLHKGSAFEK